MVICLIALPILAILAIFSATHRKLFLESLDCVFRKATFRKCQSSLDERLKVKLSGALINKNPKLGNFVFKNFEVLSFIFLVLMVLSFVFSTQGVYNYVRYDNCNGVDSEEFCILNFDRDNNSNISQVQKITDKGEVNCTTGNV